MPTFLRTAPNIYEFEGYRFFPGTNFVPNDTYKKWQEKCKESFEKHFKLQLEGTPPAMRIVADTAKDANNLSEVIAALSPKEAIALIGETLSVVDLEKSLILEKRKPVVAALKKQIDEMKRMPSKDELMGSVKQSEPPPTGNLMDNLNIEHDFKKPDKY